MDTSDSSNESSDEFFDFPSDEEYSSSSDGEHHLYSVTKSDELIGLDASKVANIIDELKIKTKDKFDFKSSSKIIWNGIDTSKMKVCIYSYKRSRDFDSEKEVYYIFFDIDKLAVDDYGDRTKTDALQKLSNVADSTKIMEEYQKIYGEDEVNVYTETKEAIQMRSTIEIDSYKTDDEYKFEDDIISFLFPSNANMTATNLHRIGVNNEKKSEEIQNSNIIYNFNSGIVYNAEKKKIYLKMNVVYGISDNGDETKSDYKVDDRYNFGLAMFNVKYAKAQSFGNTAQRTEKIIYELVHNSILQDGISTSFDIDAQKKYTSVGLYGTKTNLTEVHPFSMRFVSYDKTTTKLPSYGFAHPSINISRDAKEVDILEGNFNERYHTMLNGNKFKMTRYRDDESLYNGEWVNKNVNERIDLANTEVRFMSNLFAIFTGKIKFFKVISDLTKNDATNSKDKIEGRIGANIEKIIFRTMYSYIKSDHLKQFSKMYDLLSVRGKSFIETEQPLSMGRVKTNRKRAKRVKKDENKTQTEEKIKENEGMERVDISTEKTPENPVVSSAEDNNVLAQQETIIQKLDNIPESKANLEMKEQIIDFNMSRDLSIQVKIQNDRLSPLFPFRDIERPYQIFKSFLLFIIKDGSFHINSTNVFQEIISEHHCLSDENNPDILYLNYINILPQQITPLWIFIDIGFDVFSSKNNNDDTEFDNLLVDKNLVESHRTRVFVLISTICSRFEQYMQTSLKLTSLIRQENMDHIKGFHLITDEIAVQYTRPENKTNLVYLQEIDVILKKFVKISNDTMVKHENGGELSITDSVYNGVSDNMDIKTICNILKLFNGINQAKVESEMQKTVDLKEDERTLKYIELLYNHYKPKPVSAPVAVVVPVPVTVTVPVVLKTDTKTLVPKIGESTNTKSYTEYIIEKENKYTDRFKIKDSETWWTDLSAGQDIRKETNNVFPLPKVDGLNNALMVDIQSFIYNIENIMFCVACSVDIPIQFGDTASMIYQLLNHDLVYLAISRYILRSYFIELKQKFDQHITFIYKTLYRAKVENMPDTYAKITKDKDLASGMISFVKNVFTSFNKHNILSSLYVDIYLRESLGRLQTYASKNYRVLMNKDEPTNREKIHELVNLIKDIYTDDIKKVKRGVIYILNKDYTNGKNNVDARDIKYMMNYIDSIVKIDTKLDNRIEKVQMICSQIANKKSALIQSLNFIASKSAECMEDNIKGLADKLDPDDLSLVSNFGLLKSHKAAIHYVDCLLDYYQIDTTKGDEQTPQSKFLIYFISRISGVPSFLKNIHNIKMDKVLEHLKILCCRPLYMFDDKRSENDKSSPPQIRSYADQKKYVASQHNASDKELKIRIYSDPIFGVIGFSKERLALSMKLASDIDYVTKMWEDHLHIFYDMMYVKSSIMTKILYHIKNDEKRSTSQSIQTQYPCKIIYDALVNLPDFKEFYTKIKGDYDNLYNKTELNDENDDDDNDITKYFIIDDETIDSIPKILHNTDIDSINDMFRVYTIPNKLNEKESISQIQPTDKIYDLQKAVYYMDVHNHFTRKERNAMDVNGTNVKSTESDLIYDKKEFLLFTNKISEVLDSLYALNPSIGHSDKDPFYGYYCHRQIVLLNRFIVSVFFDPNQFKYYDDILGLYHVGGIQKSEVDPLGNVYIYDTLDRINSVMQDIKEENEEKDEEKDYSLYENITLSRHRDIVRMCLSSPYWTEENETTIYNDTDQIDNVELNIKSTDVHDDYFHILFKQFIEKISDSENSKFYKLISSNLQNRYKSYETVIQIKKDFSDHTEQSSLVQKVSNALMSNITMDKDSIVDPTNIFRYIRMHYEACILKRLAIYGDISSEKKSKQAHLFDIKTSTNFFVHDECDTTFSLNKTLHILDKGMKTQPKNKYQDMTSGGNKMYHLAPIRILKSIINILNDLDSRVMHNDSEEEIMKRYLEDIDPKEEKEILKLGGDSLGDTVIRDIDKYKKKIAKYLVRFYILFQVKKTEGNENVSKTLLDRASYDNVILKSNSDDLKDVSIQNLVSYFCKSKVIFSKMNDIMLSISRESTSRYKIWIEEIKSDAYLSEIRRRLMKHNVPPLFDDTEYEIKGRYDKDMDMIDPLEYFLSQKNDTDDNDNDDEKNGDQEGSTVLSESSDNTTESVPHLEIVTSDDLLTMKVETLLNENGNLNTDPITIKSEQEMVISKIKQMYEEKTNLKLYDDKIITYDKIVDSSQKYLDIVLDKIKKSEYIGNDDIMYKEDMDIRTKEYEFNMPGFYEYISKIAKNVVDTITYASDKPYIYEIDTDIYKMNTAKSVYAKQIKDIMNSIYEYIDRFIKREDMKIILSYLCLFGKRLDESHLNPLFITISNIDTYLYGSDAVVSTEIKNMFDLIFGFNKKYPNHEIYPLIEYFLLYHSTDVTENSYEFNNTNKKYSKLDVLLKYMIHNRIYFRHSIFNSTPDNLKPLLVNSFDLDKFGSLIKLENSEKYKFKYINNIDKDTKNIQLNKYKCDTYYLLNIDSIYKSVVLMNLFLEIRPLCMHLYFLDNLIMKYTHSRKSNDLKNTAIDDRTYYMLHYIRDGMVLYYYSKVVMDIIMNGSIFLPRQFTGTVFEYIKITQIYNDIYFKNDFEYMYYVYKFIYSLIEQEGLDNKISQILLKNNNLNSNGSNFIKSDISENATFYVYCEFFLHSLYHIPHTFRLFSIDLGLLPTIKSYIHTAARFKVDENKKTYDQFINSFIYEKHNIEPLNPETNRIIHKEHMDCRKECTQEIDKIILQKKTDGTIKASLLGEIESDIEALIHFYVNRRHILALMHVLGMFNYTYTEVSGEQRHSVYLNYLSKHIIELNLTNKNNGYLLVKDSAFSYLLNDVVYKQKIDIDTNTLDNTFEKELTLTLATVYYRELHLTDSSTNKNMNKSDAILKFQSFESSIKKSRASKPRISSYLYETCVHLMKESKSNTSAIVHIIFGDIIDKESLDDHIEELFLIYLVYIHSLMVSNEVVFNNHNDIRDLYKRAMDIRTKYYKNTYGIFGDSNNSDSDG